MIRALATVQGDFFLSYRFFCMKHRFLKDKTIKPHFIQIWLTQNVQSQVDLFMEKIGVIEVDHNYDTSSVNSILTGLCEN